MILLIKRSLLPGLVATILIAMTLPVRAESQEACWDRQLVGDSNSDHVDVSFFSPNNSPLDAKVSTETKVSQINGHGQIPKNTIVTVAGGTNTFLVKNGRAFDFDELEMSLPENTDILPNSATTIPAGKAFSIPMRQAYGALSGTLSKKPSLALTSLNHGDVIHSDFLPSPGAYRTLRLQAEKPFAFKDVGKDAKMDACILVSGKWQHLNVSGFEKDANSSSAAITVVLPDDLGPKLQHFKIAVMIDEGLFIGQTSFLFIPQWLGVLAAIAVFGVIHFFIWYFVIDDRKLFARGALGKFSQAWFRGTTGAPSLSMFQIYLWTWVVVCGLTYVVAQTGDLFTLSSQVLWLLGIAGVGSLSARFLTLQTVSPISHDPKFSDILNTDDKLDPYKLQMFIFTCFSAAWVSFRVVVDETFPVLDSNLLLLMGITNGLYVGSKVVAETPAEAVARLQQDFEQADAAQRKAEEDVNWLTGELNALQNQQPADPKQISTKKTQVDDATKVLTTLQAKATALAAAVTQAKLKLNP